MILGWLASIVLQPFGDPAYRMNLLQAHPGGRGRGRDRGHVQLLTGRRLIALATGSAARPAASSSGGSPPTPTRTCSTWRSSALLFVLLLTWDQRRHSEDPETRRATPTAGSWPRPSSTASPWPTTRWPCCCRRRSGCSSWPSTGASSCGGGRSRPASRVLVAHDRRPLPGAADPGGHARPARLRPPGHAGAASSTWSWPSSSAAAWSIRSATCRHEGRPRHGPDHRLARAARLSWPRSASATSLIRRPRYVAPERARGRRHLRLRGFVRQRRHRALLPACRCFVAFTWVGLGLADVVSPGRAWLRRGRRGPRPTADADREPAPSAGRCRGRRRRRTSADRGPAAWATGVGLDRPRWSSRPRSSSPPSASCRQRQRA